MCLSAISKSPATCAALSQEIPHDFPMNFHSCWPNLSLMVGENPWNVLIAWCSNRRPKKWSGHQLRNGPRGGMPGHLASEVPLQWDQIIEVNPQVSPPLRLSFTCDRLEQPWFWLFTYQQMMINPHVWYWLMVKSPEISIFDDDYLMTVPNDSVEALNFIEFAGLSDAIEVRIGQCEELVEELRLEMNDGGILWIYIYMDYIGLCGNTMLYYWVECLDLQQEWKEWGYKPRRIWRWSSVKQQKWRSEPKWCMVEILGLCSYYFIFIFENMLEYLTTANHPSFQVPK